MPTLHAIFIETINPVKTDADYISSATGGTPALTNYIADPGLILDGHPAGAIFPFRAVGAAIPTGYRFAQNRTSKQTIGGVAGGALWGITFGQEKEIVFVYRDSKGYDQVYRCRETKVGAIVRLIIDVTFI